LAPARPHSTEFSGVTSAFDLTALLLVLAAVLAFWNHRVLRLPMSVGLLVSAFGGTLLLLLADALLPELGIKAAIRHLLAEVNFPATLLRGLLAFLLFAGALEVEFAELIQRKWTILALAGVGTVLSTLFVAATLSLIASLVSEPVPFAWCLVFGALISPTDPVTVLDVLRRVGIPRRFEAVVSGESLFNDGIGVVLFTLMVALATGTVEPKLSAPAIAGLFLLNAIGGGLLGLGLGYVAFLLLRQVDDYNVELIISLALVTATYSIAGMLDVSGPVAVVVAGILIGNHGMHLAMSETTRQHIRMFWRLVDQTLNAILFLLIGLEIAAIELTLRGLATMMAMIPLMLLIRWCSAAASALPLNLRLPGKFPALAILTWGGLRGALSVAMALSLPDSRWRDMILTVTYGIVVFSIVVQGLTLDTVARALLRPAGGTAPGGPDTES
jgi:CPA1 family monovalent cation:H+ antiporter